MIIQTNERTKVQIIERFAKDIMKWKIEGNVWKRPNLEAVHKDYIEEMWNPFEHVEDAINLVNQFKSFTLTGDSGSKFTCVIFYNIDDQNIVYRKKATGESVESAICNCVMQILNI